MKMPTPRPIRAFTAGFPSLDACIATDGIFGRWFNGPSWDSWRTVLRAVNGLPLDEQQTEFFREVAGGRDAPQNRAQEIWIIAGRRSGKDSVVSAVAAREAAAFIPTCLRPGERAAVLCAAPDRATAKIVWGYIASYFEQIPDLAKMVERIAPSEGVLELSNRVDIVVTTGTRWTGRGRPVLLAIFDELGFFRDENSANPDVEIYNSVLPSLATIPNSRLIAISAPYRASGLLHQKWKSNYGKNDDATLVIQSPSHRLNPTLDTTLRDRQMAEDPVSARPEWYADTWREDLSTFISRSDIEVCVDAGVTVRPPETGVQYMAHIDASSGSGRDSFCCSVGHKVGDFCIIDRLIEIRPPFSPPDAVSQISAMLTSYGITRANCDRWGLGFVETEFRRHGIELNYSDKSSSEIFRQALPIIRSGRARLLDNERAITQFCNLERRLLPGGSERIGHPERSNFHDDVAVVCAGLLVALSTELRGAESLIEVYRRQAEAVTNQVVTAPQAVERFGHMQVGGQKVAVVDPVKIVVPPKMDISTYIGGVSGLSHNVQVENGQRVVWLGKQDATALLVSGQPGKEAWSASNREIAQRLHQDKPPAPPTISPADYFAEFDNRPRHIFDRGGFVNDALREMGILR